MVWVPRNGAREKHVERVTHLVSDPRAVNYWDGHQAAMAPYNEMFSLTGPCAGVFMVFGPDQEWGAAGAPRPIYAEDAHAEEFNRELPQFDADRFAEFVRGVLP